MSTLVADLATSYFRLRELLDAIVEAAGTRLRPILMTTAATVVGHLPFILATGPGAGARNSIGIVLVSGMIVGTLFTLFVVPSIYLLVARKHAGTVSAEVVRMETETGVVVPFPCRF